MSRTFRRTKYGKRILDKDYRGQCKRHGCPYCIRNRLHSSKRRKIMGTDI